MPQSLWHTHAPPAPAPTWPPHCAHACAVNAHEFCTCLAHPAPWAASPAPQLPLHEPGCLEVVELIESEVLCSLPWVTTDNFVSCVQEGRIELEVYDRRGDPTGLRWRWR